MSEPEKTRSRFERDGAHWTLRLSTAQAVLTFVLTVAAIFSLMATMTGVAFRPYLKSIAASTVRDEMEQVDTGMDVLRVSIADLQSSRDRIPEVYSTRKELHDMQREHGHQMNVLAQNLDSVSSRLDAIWGEMVRQRQDR